MLDVFQKHLESADTPAKCVVGKWAETLDDKTRAVFQTLIEKKVETSGLYRDLVSNGYQLPFKSTVFRMHMKGYCVCQSK